MNSKIAKAKKPTMAELRNAHLEKDKVQDELRSHVQRISNQMYIRNELQGKIRRAEAVSQTCHDDTDFLNGVLEQFQKHEIEGRAKDQLLEKYHQAIVLLEKTTFELTDLNMLLAKESAALARLKAELPAYEKRLADAEPLCAIYDKKVEYYERVNGWTIKLMILFAAVIWAMKFAHYQMRPELLIPVYIIFCLPSFFSVIMLTKLRG